MEDEQIIEVDYDENLVDEYKNNYIMEEEGIGADPDAEPYDTQTTLNETPLVDMFDDGEVIVDEVIDDDKEN